MAFRDVAKGSESSPRELRVYPGCVKGYLTAGAVREWFQNRRHVSVLIDREYSRLGIKRTRAPEGSEQYKLTSGNYSDGRKISLISSLRQLGIEIDDMEAGYTAPLEWDSAKNLVVADMSGLVERQNPDVIHCTDCGKRCSGSQGLETHYGHEHDASNPRKLLEEMDPDEPFPAAVGGGD